MARVAHFLALLAAVLLAPLRAQAELPVAPFTADFNLYAGGIPIGKAVLALDALGECGYRMRSRLAATGIARFLYPDVITETSLGRISDAGVPEPTVYRHTQRGGNNEHVVEADFRWGDMRANARHDERRRDVQLWRRVVDPLSLFVLAMSDLKRGHLASQYNLLHKAYRRSYKVSHQGRERLTTPLGEVSALRVTRQRENSNRATVLWFAEELDYLPVQVVHLRDGAEHLRLTIESLER